MISKVAQWLSSGKFKSQDLIDDMTSVESVVTDMETKRDNGWFNVPGNVNIQRNVYVEQGESGTHIPIGLTYTPPYDTLNVYDPYGSLMTKDIHYTVSLPYTHIDLVGWSLSADESVTFEVAKNTGVVETSTDISTRLGEAELNIEKEMIKCGELFLETDLSQIPQTSNIIQLSPSISYVIPTAIDLTNKTIYGNGATILVTNTLNVAITCYNTTLKDLNINGNYAAQIGISATGDYFYCDNVNVQKFGTYVNRSQTNLRIFAEKAVIVNSSFNLSNGSGIDIGNTSVVYGYNMALVVKNCTISSNQCYGLVMREDNNTLSSIMIENCEVYSNGASGTYSGITCHFMDNVSVINCKAYSNQEHGIVLMDCKNSHIIGNSSYSNGGSGLRMQADSTRTENSRRGVYNTVVSNNMFHHNTEYGIKLGGYIINANIENNMCFNNLRPIVIQEDYTNHLCQNINFNKNNSYDNTDTNYIVFKEELSQSFYIDSDAYQKDFFLMPQRIYNPTTVRNVITNSNLDISGDTLTNWTVYGTITSGNIAPDGSNRLIGNVFTYQDNDYLTVCTKLGTFTGKIYIAVIFRGTNVTTGGGSSYQCNVDDIARDINYFNNEIIVNTVNLSKLIHDNTTIVKANIAQIELMYYSLGTTSAHFISSHAAYGKEIPYVV